MAMQKRGGGRGRSGTCAMHQRKLRTAITRARIIALLPYVGD